MIAVHFVASATQQAPGATTLQCRAGQSLMQSAVASNVAGIEADCGGMMTCATCHVYVREPHASRLPPPGAEESAMLQFTAAPRRPNSRLCCQIVLTSALDGLTVDLPDSQY